MFFAFYKYNTRPWYKSFYGYAVAYMQFLKGDKNWQYCHVEFVKQVNGDYQHWYGCTGNSGLRKRTKKNVKNDHWHRVYIDGSEMPTKPEKWFLPRVGAKYDWLAIFFTEGVDLELQDKDKYYCSESCAASLGIKPAQMRVSEFYNMLVKEPYVIAESDTCLRETSREG